MDAMAFSNATALNGFIQEYYQLKCDRTNIELMCQGVGPEELVYKWAEIGPVYREK